MLWGNVAAIATAIVIFCVWVLVVNGALPTDMLANASGTALIPLAEKVGPVVLIFGSLYVVLSMGMGTIHISLGIFYQIRERLGYSSRNKSDKRVAMDQRDTPVNWLRSERVQFIIGLIPMILVLMIVEWMLWTGQESFAGIIGFFGVVIIPLLAGIFPMLMLVASRRKGDYVPGVIWLFLGNPLVVLAIYLTFLVSILLYGLVIWEDPLQRALALLVALGMVAATFLFIWQGVYNWRYVVELRAGLRHARLSFTESGKAAYPNSKFGYSSGEEITFNGQGEIPRYSDLRRITADLERKKTQELKVWAHQIAPEGISLPLPGMLTLKGNESSEDYNLEDEGGEVIKPMEDAIHQVIISLEN